MLLSSYFKNMLKGFHLRGLKNTFFPSKFSGVYAPHKHVCSSVTQNYSIPVHAQADI